MQIYTHALGAHLKVHSFEKTPPAERANAVPPALMLVCHGIYQGTTGTTPVPAAPRVHFAVQHGHANGNIDARWFQDLITEGLPSALEFDFKYVEAAQAQVTNYFLGKGEPDRAKGAGPAEWLGYVKADRLPHPSGYQDHKVKEVGILSSSYVENIMRFAESKQKTATFDFATVRRSCRNLSDVFGSMAINPPPNYEYLLCAFCRELA
jgi:hypothetical protein